MSKTSPFSEWLVHTGTALGYRTNTSLAKALDVPQPTVSRWKSGSKPSVEHLVKLSELFGVELKTLLVLAGYMKGDVDKKSRPPLTAPERIINESEAGDIAKELLSSFWAWREAEELDRLRLLVEGLQSSMNITGIYDPQSLEPWVDQATQTELHKHVQKLVRSANQRSMAHLPRLVLYYKNMPKDGEPDLFVEAEDAYAPVRAQVLQRAEGWAFEVIPDDGEWAVVCSPFKGQRQAEESLLAWLSEHPNFQVKEDESAPEEEDPS